MRLLLTALIVALFGFAAALDSTSARQDACLFRTVAQ